MSRLRSHTLSFGEIRGSIICLVLGIGFFVLADSVTEDGRVRIDRWLALALHRHASHGMTRSMRVATEFGSGTITVPLILCLVGWLVWRRRRQTAAVIAIFWIGAQIIDLFTKPFFHRDRPSFFPAMVRAGGYSFPSGHTVTALMTYGLIAAVLTIGKRGWRVVIPSAVASGIVIVVAVSRVYLGAHYPSDVFGSLLIGGAWLQLAILVLLATGRQQSTPSGLAPGSD